MGTKRNSIITDLRDYVDPLNPAASNYNVLLPKTSFEAVRNDSGGTLQDVLGGSCAWEVYTCTGTADSTAVANLVNNFFTSGTAMTKKIKIVGTMGVAFTFTYYAMLINAANTRGATCYLDFSECIIPEITTASRDFLYVSSATAKLNVTGLTVTATRYGIYIAGGGSGVFTKCKTTGGASTSSRGVFLDSGSAGSFDNCTITAYGLQGALVANSSNGNFSNCEIITFGTQGFLLNNGSCVILSNCVISGINNGVADTGSATRVSLYNCVINCSNGYGVNFANDAKLFNCTINSTTDCVYLPAAHVGQLLLQSCKIIGTTRGIYMISANTDAEIKLLNCQVKGGTQDIQQTTAANTAKWYIEGNSFSKASIIVDGTTAITSKESASIYFPLYGNLFSRTID